jgi:MoaA/NifB/PqqE/SkfB family radical SAM enzyme
MFHHMGRRLSYAKAFMKKELVHVNLQLLYNCNFSCKICDFWKGEWASKPRLSLENARLLSDKLAQENPMVISLGGGEPLLHPELNEIAAALSRHHFPVMICNGWYMTPEKARGLWESGLYEVSISLDYNDPELHDSNRGQAGAFEKALEALQMLEETRIHPWQRVHMISVVMNDNLHHIEPLIQRAISMGLTYLITFYSSVRGEKQPLYSNQEISEHLLLLKKKYGDNFVTTRGYLKSIADAQEGGGVGQCKAGLNLINIDCEGNVGFCIDRIEDSSTNLLEHSMEEVREVMRKEYEKNECGRCWTSCRGSIESLMYGKNRLANIWDMHQMYKDRPLGRKVPSA